MSVHILCPPENKHIHHYVLKILFTIATQQSSCHITRSHYRISLCTFPIGGLAIPLLSIIIITLMVTLI